MSWAARAASRRRSSVPASSSPAWDSRVSPRKNALPGDVDGPVREWAETIDAMVGQLSGFASEVIRVARELGTEGRLGGQATVPHAEGIWRDITDSVNSAARNLTAQVR